MQSDVQGIIQSWCIAVISSVVSVAIISSAVCVAVISNVVRVAYVMYVFHC